MTRVIFYTHVARPLDFLCKFLARRIVGERRRAFVFARSPETAKRLDEALWQAPGFLPHCFADGDGANDTPIVISQEPPAKEFVADVLIAPGGDAPPFVGQFPQYVDIVGANETAAARGRERFVHFRDHGYPMDCHNMAGK